MTQFVNIRVTWKPWQQEYATNLKNWSILRFSCHKDAHYPVLGINCVFTHLFVSIDIYDLPSQRFTSVLYHSLHFLHVNAFRFIELSSVHISCLHWPRPTFLFTVVFYIIDVTIRFIILHYYVSYGWNYNQTKGYSPRFFCLLLKLKFVYCFWDLRFSQWRV
jgi:hypothetical protein